MSGMFLHTILNENNFELSRHSFKYKNEDIKVTEGSLHCDV